MYVHVPFCRRKCRYCDFYSRPPKADELDRFVDAVAGEASARPCVGRVETVYLGGGTPSLLGARRLTKILDELRRLYQIAGDAEITVEVNPQDVTPEFAADCLDAGFNRMSVGVQSVFAEELGFLGRLHRPADGPRAVEVLREAGFTEIGIDLIYGLPRQTPAMAEERVRLAVEVCRPTHVSAYQLTYAAGTPLWGELESGRIRRHGEDDEFALFRSVHRALRNLGYPAYEVSNFSLDDAHRSLHNSSYWRHLPYVGLGPSAHSFQPPVRLWNIADLDRYLAALAAGESPLDDSEALTDDQLAAEMVMLALRTTDGLDLAAFRERFGRDLASERAEQIGRAESEGLVVLADGCLRPTPTGLAVADRLAVELC